MKKIFGSVVALLLASSVAQAQDLGGADEPTAALSPLAGAQTGSLFIYDVGGAGSGSAMVPRLALTSDEKLALKSARRKEAGGVVVSTLGVCLSAVGAGFFAPLAHHENMGSLDPAQSAGVGGVIIAAGLGVLGGGIDLFLRGYRSAVNTVDSAWKRGGVKLSAQNGMAGLVF